MKKSKKTLRKICRYIRTACKYIINTITVMMMVVFFASMCMVDSESYIPLVCVAVSFTWCAVYLYLKEAFASDGEWVVTDDED